ncbi:MAG: D-sedoheptulose-7-phosphate isomerase [Burkholderiaceae bacterium]|jgi:D-sedoheptulose 7-phosphate isomerase|nr:SIS domain-containing protein [Betaproteobacteria bacterium]
MMQKDIQNSLEASRQMVEQCLADQALQAALVKAVNCCVNALKSGGKLMFAGNGGSAAEAQHFSAEMVGRFLTERKPLASVALSTDTSALTAIGNDYGYDQVFSRQVEALGRSGDVLIVLSTSGRSKNILAAMRAAAALGVATIAFTGREPREIGALADVVLNVPSSHTPQIQEGHLILGHLLCGLVETQFTS